MKRILSMFTVATLTVGLLGSCAKINERLDDLEKKVGGLENEKIATIDSQIASINSSISDLESLRQKVQAMSDPATGLDKRIKELEAFASDVKKNYATQEWAKTTLVTMEEYEKTCDTVAKIAAKVEGFDSDIKACADSLKRWVNEKFGGYYDIATIDAKLAELQEQVDGVDSLSAELAKTRAEIDTAKAAIRAEYRAAITSAIENFEGKLTQALRDSIDSVNATISTLTGRVDILETKVDALKGRVDSLENMIQSIKLVPTYSDGSVEVKDDTLFIDCIISPAEAVKALDSADFTILLNKVLTKAVVLDTVPTDSIKFFKTYKENGTVSIKAHIKKFLAELGEESLTVAVNVKKDKSDFTTEFVPVYVAPGPVLPAGALKGEFSVSATKKVHFSKGNLYADGDKALHFEANQYSYASSWDASHVSLFTWSSTVEAAVGNSNSGDYLFCDESHKVSVDGGEAIYYALSKDEWTYLFNNHSKKWATVNDVNGYVIAPDGFTGELASSYADDAALASAGNLVFLPAAGSRDGSSVEYVGDRGDYWSSTAGSDVSFSSDKVDLDRNLDRGSGCGVRLVTDVSAAPAPTPTTTGTAKRTGDIDVKWIQFWENGPKFAEYNVGAANNKAEDYGGYYCWGKTTNKDASGAYKSGTDPLTGDDDTATKLWGSNWRMPTQAELQALLSNCDVEWIDGTNKKYKDTNITGLLCKGKGAYASNSVFLPAAGFYSNGSEFSQGSIGYYWSSTPDDDDFPTYARDLYFDSSEQELQGDLRYRGMSVRAVLK